MPYKYDDVAVVGTLPGNCNITKITVIVTEGFDPGTILTLKSTPNLDDAGGSNMTSLLEAPSTVLVDTSGVSVQTLLNPLGNVDAVGDALTNGSGLATVEIGTDEDSYLVVTFGGGTSGQKLTMGSCEIVVEYARYKTNVGAY
jgi:hypothetical protein